VKIPSDLALGGKRFKEELPDAARTGGIFVASVRSFAGFARFAFLSARRALGRDDVLEIAYSPEARQIA